jgi:perosamine synthetase
MPVAQRLYLASTQGTMSTVHADDSTDHTSMPAAAQAPDGLAAATPAPAIDMSSFPRARAPVAPVLSLSSFGREGGAHTPSILDAKDKRFTTSGRVAIALALREMGIGAGDSVLVPSYHCASMIEPVIWSGATPVFYKIKPDTTVDLDDLATKVGPSTRLVMATNYFGFLQPLDQIRAFCDAHGLKMLEDCAHSFLGQFKGQPVGSFGDYAIASSMKFFPIYEGGCLASSRHSLANVTLRSAGVAFEAKVAFNSMEQGFSYRRLPLLKAVMSLPMLLKNLIWGQVKARAHGAKASLSPGSSDGGFGFDAAWLDKRSSLFSRAMLGLVSRRRMGALRRKNYMKLYDALSGMPQCRPLHPALPEGTYPWVFPLLTDFPEPIFKTLKMAGVPVVRFGEYLWPGVDASVCANSVDLSRRVLQFPCHQELRESELDWMIVLIKEALLAQRASA